MRIHSTTLLRTLVLGAFAILLGACSNDNNAMVVNPPPPPPPPPPPAMASFDVTVTNLSGAQPFSPVAVIAHEDAYSVFTIGTTATPGLETLAEGGDNSSLIAEADADAAVAATASGAAPIGPAASETISIEVLEGDLANLSLSVSTMLVHTNDAISGVNGVSLAGMAAGDSVSLRGNVYDAGTEANTEEAAHVPGPEFGGEGFNAARDDLADRVAMHGGVVSGDDGFATSDLTGQHRFDNPILAVRIERVN